MSLTVTTDVNCDRCIAWVFGISGYTNVQSAIARKSAARAGWTRRKVDGKFVDLCPECSEER